MPQRPRLPRQPENEAVAVLEEMLAISRGREPLSLVVIVEFESGHHHMGVTGRYSHDEALANRAVASLQDFLAKGREFLGTM